MDVDSPVPKKQLFPVKICLDRSTGHHWHLGHVRKVDIDSHGYTILVDHQGATSLKFTMTCSFKNKTTPQKNDEYDIQDLTWVFLFHDFLIAALQKNILAWSFENCFNLTVFFFVFHPRGWIQYLKWRNPHLYVRLM